MREPKLHEQYQDLERQAHAARLGMWGFLGSEVLLFSGLFALYAAYRVEYPADFAEGIRHNKLAIGSANALILVITSFTAVMGLHALRSAHLRRAFTWYMSTVGGGVLFLFLKGYEYAEHFREGVYPGPAYHFAELPTRGANIFFTLYFYMTGLHAIHLIVGIVLIFWTAWSCWRGIYSSANYTRAENCVLYWHLVDCFWMFIWPLLYLTHL